MPAFSAADIPCLAARTRLRYDPAREADVLLFPEGVLMLNQTAAAILKLCDGTQSVQTIVSRLSEHANGIDVMADVLTLLDRLAAKGLVEGYAT
ncbi:MAG TPA: pyrroloquinoline quinone biosynthesis peptide chaperone PqqD [Chloroflexota bacterium]|jgi:coenzyme PQQ biosynthesis protein PqqD